MTHEPLFTNENGHRISIWSQMTVVRVPRSMWCIIVNVNSMTQKIAVIRHVNDVCTLYWRIVYGHVCRGFWRVRNLFVFNLILFISHFRWLSEIFQKSWMSKYRHLNNIKICIHTEQYCVSSPFCGHVQQTFDNCTYMLILLIFVVIFVFFIVFLPLPSAVDCVRIIQM